MLPCAVPPFPADYPATLGACVVWITNSQADGCRTVDTTPFRDTFVSKTDDSRFPESHVVPWSDIAFHKMSRPSPTARHLSTMATAVIVIASCTVEQPPRDSGGAAPGGSAEPAVVCQRTAEGEAGDLSLARCLATPELVPADASGDGPLVVYFDRSGSMRGFLDPHYPTRIPTDYRSVIDRLVVGLRPTRGFSFGAALRTADPTLATLGNREFYTDRDTQTEQVLAEIGRDTASRETHIIVTDGRRGSPTAADAQFVRMREHATRWVARGGSFVVATSLAPFQTVATDPSGCHRSTTAAAGEPQTCPLYLFGFVAAGDERRITTALASVFEHLFVWPAPTIPAGTLTLVPEDPDRRDLRIERRWASAPNGTPIMRVRGDSATNRTLTATIALRDTSSADARAYAALLRDQGTRIELYSRGFTAAAAAQPWRPVEARGALVRASDASAAGVAGESQPARQAIDLVTRGARGPVTMFRVDLVPTGAPLWLEEFAAKDAGDVVRTYGLGRLFEGFRAQASGSAGPDERPRPLARFFIVAS